MDIPRNWRLRRQRYGLEGAECTDCGAIHFPPRRQCRHCRSRDMVPRTLNGRGTLLSYSVIYQAPHGFESQLPYAVGLVELEDGPRLTTMLTDIDNQALAVGLPVEMVIRKLHSDGADGLIQYGYKFRPVQFD